MERNDRNEDLRVTTKYFVFFLPSFRRAPTRVRHPYTLGRLTILNRLIPSDHRIYRFETTLMSRGGRTFFGFLRVTSVRLVGLHPYRHVTLPTVWFRIGFLSLSPDTHFPLEGGWVDKWTYGYSPPQTFGRKTRGTLTGTELDEGWTVDYPHRLGLLVQSTFRLLSYNFEGRHYVGVRPVSVGE